jgi:hypothetical protein
MRRTNHNPKYTTRITNVVTDAVIINQDEWRRIKQDSVYLTAEQHADIRRRTEQSWQEAMAQIQAKRAVLISPDVTQETASRTHSILGSTEERDYAVKIAKQKADEDLDEIKHIRSQMVAAEARTVRDGQLIENAELRAAHRRREREWADELEANRREALKLYEDRETSLREQRRRGRDVISAQIKEHKINTILEAERRDREAKALREQNELVTAEDRRIEQERRRRQQAFLHDCLADEAARKERRSRERELEKDEVAMVIEVAAQRSLAEQALEQERADQRALKEREINQIRKRQQRAIDSKAIRDEEMAIKVQREKDEIARERERRELATKQRLAAECKADREIMVRTKKERLIDERTMEQAEAQLMIERNRAARLKARQEWERKVQIDANYRQELGESAQREWQAKQPDLKKKAKERQEIIDGNEAYLAKINRMREEKLEILRRRGVPEKHLVDIKANRFELR